MASEAKPNPIKIVFNPKTDSNIETIGILPPLLVGIGSFPKVVCMALLAAL